MMLQWALKYLQLGWAVMPLRPRGKEPFLKSWKDYQSRLPTKLEVLQWFTRCPTANIAILTGSLSRLVVIDADGESGLKSQQTLGLSSPISVKTGHGAHLYFAHPGNNVCNSVKKWPGLDIRGDGGYVVAPPSIHPDGQCYRWVGSLLMTLPPLPGLFLGTESPPANLLSTLGPIAATLKDLRGGNRNDSFTRLAGGLHDGKRNSGDIFALLSPHARSCGLSDSELQTIIRSVTRYERDSESHSLDLFNGSDHLADYKHFCNAERSNDTFQTGFEQLDGAYAVMRKGEIFTIGARTGTGKTSFALALTRNLLETGKKVLLFTTEMSRFTVLERLLQPYGSRKFDTLARFGGQLFVADKSSPTVADVKKTTERVRPDVLIFDHIQHGSGLSQSSSDRENVSRLVRGLKDIAREFKCGVIACSQIKRLYKDRNGVEAPPTLSDLKESGTVEEESGAVLLLSRLSQSSEVTALMADLAKNRYGPLARFSLEFDGKNGAFREIA